MLLYCSELALMVCRFRTDNLTSGPWQHSSFYFLSAETINQIPLRLLTTGHWTLSPVSRSEFQQLFSFHAQQD